MTNEQYESILDKLGEVTVINKDLQKKNISLKREVRQLRRIIKKLKDNQEKKVRKEKW